MPLTKAASAILRLSNYRCHQPFRRWIEASPRGDLTFLVTDYGKPFTDAGFGIWFRERCDKAELKQCSAHGPRKLAATALAEAGATSHQLVAWFGRKSIKEAEIYTRAADQKKLAGTRGKSSREPIRAPREKSKH
ncbi:tyrosine-type recombinase/integrase [Hyphomicrobium sp.]|uniref:tyrosine-type recombinase/integrase n=1 Tax=Hyphomicrobium sp. TaxID=82 RepID=UPI0034592370